MLPFGAISHQPHAQSKQGRDKQRPGLYDVGNAQDSKNDCDYQGRSPYEDFEAGPPLAVEISELDR